jgi:hypothetical protein
MFKIIFFLLKSSAAILCNVHDCMVKYQIFNSSMKYFYDQCNGFVAVTRIEIIFLTPVMKKETLVMKNKPFFYTDGKFLSPGQEGEEGK